MKKLFYPRLALNGITANKRIYLPYILTCVGMVTMYYIIASLQFNATLDNIRGGGTTKMIMSFGSGVIAVFACVFLFYTNSFLIKRRKREFGLYNILGMGKRNIGLILLFETIIIALFALAAGLFFGITLSKLAELGLLKIIHSDVDYKLRVETQAVVYTLIVFLIVFALLYLNALRQVRFSTAMSLVKSENTGEKPPKANPVLGVLGLILLIAAYVIAVSIETPLKAAALFFVAVILVIIGTYLIMIAGSVVFCRLLQRKKNYYYKANHFVSVSSMVYRMKRNGAGLASICILATMVLVMISSTSSLYFGAKDSCNALYPRDFVFTAKYDINNISGIPQWEKTTIKKALLNEAEKNGAKTQEIVDYGYAYFTARITDGVISPDAVNVNTINPDEYKNVFQFFIVSIEDYNRNTGKSIKLAGNEAAVQYSKDCSLNTDEFSVKNGKKYKIKTEIHDFAENGDYFLNASGIKSVVLFVNDPDKAIEKVNFTDTGNADICWKMGFNTSAGKKKQIELFDIIPRALTSDNPAIDSEKLTYEMLSLGSRAASNDDFYQTYGGLFYLGIALSVVFIIAAVLIIYYKQILEGYEDSSRFMIMQKVGMTKREIKRSINSQLLTVFFLPLLFAGMHLGFAFPVIKKLLVLFQFDNFALFSGVTVVSFLLFALLYTLVYKITSNAYYSIVSGNENAK